MSSSKDELSYQVDMAMLKLVRVARQLTKNESPQVGVLVEANELQQLRVAIEEWDKVKVQYIEAARKELDEEVKKWGSA